MPPSAVGLVKEKLNRHPHVQYVEGPGWLRILPVAPDGFTVELREEDGGYFVAFDGWHERFDDAGEALDCLAFGLSDQARLKVTARGGRAYRWTLEYRDDEGWREDSTTGQLLFRFWGRYEERYLQNRVIRTDER